MRHAASKLLVGVAVIAMVPMSLTLTASAGSIGQAATTTTTAPATNAMSSNSGFVNVVPSPSTETTYFDSGSANVFYGILEGPDEVTIGEEHTSWSLNLNGRQVQILQTLRNVQNGLYPEPQTAADLSWQCWTAAGSVCVPPSDTLSGYDHMYGYTSSQVGYSYTPGDITTYSILPNVNGTYFIHLNWNWLALGYTNPNTSNGRFNAPPIISAPIVCNYSLTTPCSFS